MRLGHAQLADQPSTQGLPFRHEHVDRHALVGRLTTLSPQVGTIVSAAPVAPIRSSQTNLRNVERLSFAAGVLGTHDKIHVPPPVSGRLRRVGKTLVHNEATSEHFLLLFHRRSRVRYLFEQPGTMDLVTPLIASKFFQPVPRRPRGAGWSLLPVSQLRIVRLAKTSFLIDD